MKNLVYIIYLLLPVGLFSCSQEEEEDMEAGSDQPTVSTVEAKPSNDPCLICQLEIDIIKAENKMFLMHRDPNRKPEMDRAKAIFDSLNVVYNQLIVPYNGDINAAKQACSANYKTDAVTDTAQRNALFAEFFVWYHNSGFPEFDTTAYVPVIKNGQYEVNHNGKITMMSKNQHAQYLTRGLKTRLDTKAIFDAETTRLASLLTGMEKDKIDELCISVLGYLSLSYQLHPNVKKIKESGAEYLKYMKIQTDWWGS